jgi:hypothetical protein
MRVFANLFLILFLADGVIAIFDEIISLFLQETSLSDLRMSVAGLVNVMSIAIYFCLGIDRRLPKRLFLPLLIFVFWRALDAWFFPGLADNRTYGLLAASSQVLLGILPVYYNRTMVRPGLLMNKAMFQSPFFNMRNTLLFGAASLVIIPIALLLLGLSAASTYLDKQTSGFARLAPDGLYMAERVYRRDSQTIRLASMIHVGEKKYYQDLVGSLPSERTVVLTEGVSDRQNLLRNKFGYGKMAGFLGLTSQDTMQFNGRLINAAEMEKPGFKGGGAGTADILRADVDLRSFHPTTISFLNVLGKHMTDSSSFIGAMISFNAWAGKNVTPEVNKTIMDDILYRRNKEVIRHLGKVLSRYQTIVIPWGALHMHEIEASVLAHGFVLQENRERISIDFLKILPR